METLDENVKMESPPGERKLTPNAIKGLVFGIVSIASSGFIVTGVIFAILSFNASKKDMPIVEQDPVKYKAAGSLLKSGRVCAYIGLVVTALTVLYYFVIFSSGLY